MTTTYTNVWVCTDCYFAHHYGVTEVDRPATDDETSDWHGGYLRTGHSVPNVIEETDHGLVIREWFAGESDSPADRKPLGLIDDQTRLADNTSDPDDDPDADAGIDDFSWRSCQGCGSTLGGSRYRLAVWS